MTRNAETYHTFIDQPEVGVDLDKKVDPQFLDPTYWHPKCSNFEIIDWKKWQSLNPTPPKIYDPPQKKSYSSAIMTPLWWWNRSCYCQPIPCCIQCTRVCAPKPEMDVISRDTLMQRLLTSNPYSDYVPEAFRNALFWTDENSLAPETLLSFNRWAWRSQTDEPGRVIGLGNIRYDWTVNPGCFGQIFGFFQKTRYVTVQASPDGKWMALATFSDPSPKGMANYLWIYVVQEGDEFQTPDGKVIEHVRPGDLVRLSWGDGSNPYYCNNENLEYSYFPRKVARLDPLTGQVSKIEEHYQDLLQKATNEPHKCCRTCGYTCSCCMSAEERFDFQVSNISDLQCFAMSPEPPSPQVLDRL